MSKAVSEVSDADFERIVLQSDSPVLVDFWAEWCSPCKMMGPVLESVADELSPSQLTVVKLNVDNNPAVTGKYAVMSIPTLVLFKKGAEIGRLVGFRPKDDLIKKITALL